MTLEPILEVCHLSKSFGTHQVLRDVNFTVHPGDVTSILGSSGSGKSTLLRCINLLERPTEGSVVIDGVEMEKLTPAQLRQRRREITMIFQQFNLLMQRTCLRNIMFPMELAKVPKEKAEARAREQARKEYENSALVQTIRKLVERNHGQWSGTAKEILEAGRLLTRRFIAETPQELSCQLREIRSQLMEMDNISYQKGKHGTAGAKHIFCKEEYDQLAQAS